MLRTESQNHDVMHSVSFSHVLRIRSDTPIYILNSAGRPSVRHVPPLPFVVPPSIPPCSPLGSPGRSTLCCRLLLFLFLSLLLLLLLLLYLLLLLSVMFLDRFLPYPHSFPTYLPPGESQQAPRWAWSPPHRYLLIACPWSHDMDRIPYGRGAGWVHRRGHSVDESLYGIIGVLAFFFNRALNRVFASYVFPPPGTSVEPLQIFQRSH